MMKKTNVVCSAENMSRSVCAVNTSCEFITFKLSSMLGVRFKAIPKISMKFLLWLILFSSTNLSTDVLSLPSKNQALCKCCTHMSIS